VHAVSQASFPLTLPSLVRPGGSRRAARGEGEKKHVFNKIPPVPFFRAGARKDKPRAFLGRGLPCGTLPPGRERDWDPRDASVGPLAAGGRGGAGPFRGPEARPTREAEAAISRSAPGLGSGPSNLARGRQRVRSLFGCPSRPPGGRCSRWCTGRFFKRSHPGGMPDDPQQPVHRGKRAFQPRLNIRARARQSNRGAIEGGNEAGGRL